MQTGTRNIEQTHTDCVSGQEEIRKLNSVQIFAERLLEALRGLNEHRYTWRANDSERSEGII